MPPDPPKAAAMLGLMYGSQLAMNGTGPPAASTEACEMFPQPIGPNGDSQEPPGICHSKMKHASENPAGPT